MLKKTLKWTGFVGGVLVLLVIGAVLFFISPPGERVLKGFAEGEAEAALGQTIRIDRLSTNLFSRASVHGVMVADSSGTVPLVALDSATVSYSFWPLLSGRVELGTVVIRGLALHIVRDSSGRLNLPTIASDTTSSAGEAGAQTAFSIDSLILSDLSIRYEDVPLAIEADISGARVSAVGIGRPKFTFSALAESLRVKLDTVMAPVFRLAAGGLGDSTGVTLDSLQLNGGGLAVNAAGILGAESPSGLKLDLTASGDPNSLVNAIVRYTGMANMRTSDDFKAAVRVGGTTDAPDVTAEVSLSKVESYGTDLHDARLRFAWKANEVTVDTLGVGVFGGRVDGSAKIFLDSLPQSTADLRLSGVSIRQLMIASRPTPLPYTGVLSGTVTITAFDTALAGLRLRSSLFGRKLTYLDKSLPDLKARVDVDTGRVRLDINQDELAVAADLRLPGDSVVGTFSAFIPELASYGALFDLPTLSGEIRAKGRVSGLSGNPSVFASAVGSHLKYRNIPIDTLNADVSWIDSALQVGHAYLKKEFTVIDPLYPPLEIDSLAGSYGFEMTASGSLEDLTAHARLRLREMTYGSYTIDSADLSVSAEGQTISLDTGRVVIDSFLTTVLGRFDMADSGGVLSVDLFQLFSPDSADNVSDDGLPYLGHGEAAYSLLANGETEVTFVGREFAVRALAAFAGKPAPFGGVLNVAAELKGTPESPFGRIRLTFEKPDYRGIALDSIVAQAILSPNRLRLDTLRLFGAGQDFFAAVEIELGRDSTGGFMVPEDGRTSGRVRADRIELQLLEPLLPGGMRVSGLAAMDIAWNGTIKKPNTEGRIRMSEAYFVARPGLDSITNFSVAMSSTNTELQIDTASGLFNAMPFSVAGSVAINPWESMQTDLRFTSEGLGRLVARGELSTERLDLTLRVDTLALGLFEPFVPMIDSLDGTLSCDLTITGSPDDPEITGSLLSRNVMIKPMMMDSTIRNGLLKVSFTQTEVVIDSLYSSLGKGWILLNGTIGYDNGEIAAINLDLTADHLYLSSRAYGRMMVDSSRLNYASTNDGFLCSGRINLGESRLTKDFDAELILPWTRTVETAPSDWPEMVKKTALDIEVRENNRLWIDNNLAKIRMQLSIAVVGTGARPNLSGQVVVDEGYMLYLDRKFDITQGSVLMSHPTRINPDISLAATTKVTTYSEGINATTYKIDFTAVGPMDQLQTSLTSDPPLDEANIVSLLTLGALRDQLVSSGGQNGTGAGAVLTARAARLTSERLAGIASRQIENALGLEEFTVQGNLFDIQENGGPQLLASKKLSERVKLTYLTTVGNANDQTIRLDYRLTSRVSLEGQTNREGQAVLNIKFGLRFK